MNDEFLDKLAERLFGPQGIDMISWDQRIESEIDYLLDLHQRNAFWGNEVQGKIRARLKDLITDVQSVTREEKK